MLQCLRMLFMRLGPSRPRRIDQLLFESCASTTQWNILVRRKLRALSRSAPPAKQATAISIGTWTLLISPRQPFLGLRRNRFFIALDTSLPTSRTLLSFPGVSLLSSFQRKQQSSVKPLPAHGNLKGDSQHPQALRTRQIYHFPETHHKRPNKRPEDGAHIPLSLLSALGHGSTSASVSQYFTRDPTPTSMHQRELPAWLIKDEEARSTSASAQEEARSRDAEVGGFEMIACLDDSSIP